MSMSSRSSPIPMTATPATQYPAPGLLKEPVIDKQPKIAKSEVEETPSSPSPTPPDRSLLEELTAVDNLLITKRLQVRNVLALKGKRNKFFVKTPDEKIVYTVEEENRWWVGYLLYGLRPMELKVSNSQGEEIMRIERPYACSARVLPCQLQRLKIYAPPGTVVGTVEQQWSAVKPMYLVKNQQSENVFWILGPYITLSCFSDVKFSITRMDGTSVGGTYKPWLGLTHALFFSPVKDKFGVAFDVNLSLEEKALLLAATLLLDYMYYDV